MRNIHWSYYYFSRVEREQWTNIRQQVDFPPHKMNHKYSHICCRKIKKIEVKFATKGEKNCKKRIMRHFLSRFSFVFCIFLLWWWQLTIISSFPQFFFLYIRTIHNTPHTRLNGRGDENETTIVVYVMMMWSKWWDEWWVNRIELELEVL